MWAGVRGHGGRGTVQVKEECRAGAAQERQPHPQTTGTCIAGNPL